MRGRRGYTHDDEKNDNKQACLVFWHLGGGGGVRR